MQSPAPPAEPEQIKGAFTGPGGQLFWLALQSAVWTLLTLGLYRFWMKTKLRRWYWSAVRPGGIPLEYVGAPLEKLLGFLIAVVIMAFYIGIVNLVLMFVSFALLANNFGAYALSIAGVIPIWFFARYRARRYVLARTRWRGVRFGLEPGAWGYAWWALAHWAATLLTFGLLWPRMTFWLEKYITDRTFFGNERLHQGGDWKMLQPAMVHVLVPLVLGAMSVAVAANDGFPRVYWLLLVFVPWLVYGVAHYRVETKRILANHKTLGGMTFEAHPKPTKILRVWIFGTLAAGIIASVPLVLMGAAYGAYQSATIGEEFGEAFLDPTVLGLVSIVSYFVFFLTWTILRHVFITMPTWRHYAETLTLHGVESLRDVRQRGRDEFEEAEGFAEALDVGAAI